MKGKGNDKVLKIMPLILKFLVNPCQILSRKRPDRVVKHFKYPL